jgi:hypothetical protein
MQYITGSMEREHIQEEVANWSVWNIAQAIGLGILVITLLNMAWLFSFLYVLSHFHPFDGKAEAARQQRESVLHQLPPR